MPPTNQPKRTSILQDLDDEEISMLNDCISKIRKHVDSNIGRTKDAGQLARLLIFRKHLSGNIQRYKD